MEVARRYAETVNCAHMGGEDGIRKGRIVSARFARAPSSEVPFAGELPGRRRHRDFLDMNCF